MRAVVYEAYDAVPRVRDVPDPVCPPDGVVITVGATGVCRSDWHAWKGHDPVRLPHIPGHEFAGAIAAVGPNVNRWQVGDRVTAPFVCGCGHCAFCRAGEAQVCPDQTQPGFTGPGSFAEFLAIEAADTNLVALPDGVDAVAAASLGCRLATAFRALTVHGRLSSGQWLAVHGCGGVGLSAVMIATAVGARVVAIDVGTEPLARALALGAEHVVDAREQSDVAATVRELTDGGAHVSLDAAGSPSAAVACLRGLRRRGRHVQVGLLLGAQSTPPLPMDIVIARELEVYGSHGMAAHDYPPMLELVSTGLLQPGLLVGRVIGLDAAGDALAGMDRAGICSGMTVVDLSV